VEGHDVTARSHASPFVAVVDDDTAYIELLCELLADEGMRVECFLNSGEAYRELARLRPDVIVLDVRLERPEAGWQLLELLRLDRATARIPVVVCSADAKFLREKADQLRAHWAEPLEKPFVIEELLEKIRLALRPSLSAS
jgi:DNA-binding response OmpR family regulator